MDARANQSIEPTGGSRFCQCTFVSQRRLPRVAQCSSFGGSGGVTHRSDTGQMENIMNKKLITLVSVAVVAAVFSLMAIEGAIGRFMPIGQAHNLVFNAVEVVASLLALPVRLYAFFHGYQGSWSLPVLIFLLALSGLMWGVIVERMVWLFSKRSTAQ
jgi:hypothetical protein